MGSGLGQEEVDPTAWMPGPGIGPELALGYKPESPGTAIRATLRYVDHQGDPRVREVLQRHVFAPRERRVTMHVLGQQFGISRERVRQLAQRGRKLFGTSLPGIPIPTEVASRFASQTDQYLPREDLYRQLTEFLALDDDTDLGEVSQIVLQLAGIVEMNESAFQAHVHERLIRAGAEIKKSSAAILDQKAVARRLKNLVAPKYINHFLEHVVKATMFNGVWIRSDSLRSRVRAILELSPVPLTRDELAQAAGTTPTKATSIASDFSDVKRIDRHHWAITADAGAEYQTVPNAIEKRILAGGGRERFKTLIREVSRKCDVSEATVRAYIQSAQFVREGEYVRLHTANDSLRIGDPSRFPKANYTAEGWAFDVDLKDVHFRGYSLSIPVDVAAANDIPPAARLLVPIRDTNEQASVIWRLSSTSGMIDVGRVRPHLTAAGYQLGDTVRVVPKPNEVIILPPEQLPAVHYNGAARVPKVYDPLLDFLEEA